jgi:hypothetical protein
MSSAIFAFLHTGYTRSTHTISLYFAWLLSLYYLYKSKQFKGGVAVKSQNVHSKLQLAENVSQIHDTIKLSFLVKYKTRTFTEISFNLSSVA